MCIDMGVPRWEWADEGGEMEVGIWQGCRSWSEPELVGAGVFGRSRNFHPAPALASTNTVQILVQILCVTIFVIPMCYNCITV